MVVVRSDLIPDTYLFLFVCLFVFLILTQGVLTAMAQLVGCRPAKQKVAGSVPGQGTCLGCGFSPQLGCILEAAD